MKINNKKGKKKQLELSAAQKKDCEKIIHAASVTAGAIGGAGPQLILADHALITPIQIRMIVKIGSVFGQSLTDTAAKAILSGATAAIVGRGVTQVLFGLIPFIGHVINVGTAAGLTELIGWLAVKHFCKNQQSKDVCKNVHSNNKSGSCEKDLADELISETELFLSGELRYEDSKEQFETLKNKIDRILPDYPENHDIYQKYHLLLQIERNQ